MKVSGTNGLIEEVSRSNTAAADRKETCCSRMIFTRVGNPVDLPQRGGSPWLARMTASSLSRDASSRAASASVLGVISWDRPCSNKLNLNQLAPESENFQTRLDHHATHSGVPIECGSCSNPQKTFRGEIAQYK